MGMDLEACKPKEEKFESCHFNWTGWRMLANVLTQLNADTSEMSGMNDGDLISEKTCVDWADKIDKMLDEGRLLVDKIKDKSYVGGYREELVVSDHPGVMCDKESEEWLREISAFLRNCGGCKQF